MNLVTDFWIPVVLPDGKKCKVGLHGLFADAERIHDLAVNPPQRIALMRLLICIAQAALEGPEDEADWLACKERIAPASMRYLEQWRHAFALFGDKPFMQMRDLRVKPGESKALDILDFTLARGNNTTLFDHAASDEGRPLPHDATALNLLTFLNFSSQGRIGQAVLDGVQYSDPTFAAPCVDCAITLLRGMNMLESIHFNLLTKRGHDASVERLPNLTWGKPVWEVFPQNIHDTNAFENAGKSYLGRLVPLSRFVNLTTTEGANRCIVGPVHDGFRIDHLPAFREASATVVLNRNGESYRLGIDPTKHMWRELGSILSLKQGQAGSSGALPLCHLLAHFDAFPGATVDVWVGGLKTGAGGGKIVDMVEWTFPVLTEHIHERALNCFGRGIAVADDGATALSKGLKTCFSSLNCKNIPYDHARARFWSVLDRSHALLIAAARDSQATLEGWHKLVCAAMDGAYAAVCPCQTPRQIEAFARGREKLRIDMPGA